MCTADLPEPLAVKWGLHGSLSSVLAQLDTALAFYQPLWDVLDEFDSHTWVNKKEMKKKKTPGRRKKIRRAAPLPSCSPIFIIFFIISFHFFLSRWWIQLRSRATAQRGALFSETMSRCNCRLTPGTRARCHSVSSLDPSTPSPLCASACSSTQQPIFKNKMKRNQEKEGGRDTFLPCLPHFILFSLSLSLSSPLGHFFSFVFMQRSAASLE